MRRINEVGFLTWGVAHPVRQDPIWHFTVHSNPQKAEEDNSSCLKTWSCWNDSIFALRKTTACSVHVNWKKNDMECQASEEQRQIVCYCSGKLYCLVRWRFSYFTFPKDGFSWDKIVLDYTILILNVRFRKSKNWNILESGKELNTYFFYCTIRKTLCCTYLKAATTLNEEAATLKTSENSRTQLPTIFCACNEKLMKSQNSCTCKVLHVLWIL